MYYVENLMYYAEGRTGYPEKTTSDAAPALSFSEKNKHRKPKFPNDVSAL